MIVRHHQTITMIANLQWTSRPTFRSRVNASVGNDIWTNSPFYPEQVMLLQLVKYNIILCIHIVQESYFNIWHDFRPIIPERKNCMVKVWPLYPLWHSVRLRVSTLPSQKHTFHLLRVWSQPFIRFLSNI